MDDDFVFWSDFGERSLCQNRIGLPEGQKVEIVSKEDNPPNLPECRPIKNFWSILRGLVYEINCKAETLQHLKERIKYCLTKVDLADIHKTVGCTKRPLLSMESLNQIEHFIQ